MAVNARNWHACDAANVLIYKIVGMTVVCYWYLS